MFETEEATDPPFSRFRLRGDDTTRRQFCTVEKVSTKYGPTRPFVTRANSVLRVLSIIPIYLFARYVRDRVLLANLSSSILNAVDKYRAIPGLEEIGEETRARACVYVCIVS